MRLEVPQELIEALKEFKKAIIMALSISQHQATIVPIYIPISVAQVAPQAWATHSGRASVTQSAWNSNEVICPKCGRPGRLIRNRKGKRAYVLVLHGRQKCYLGPEDVVKVKRPSLAEQSVVEAARTDQAEMLSPRGCWSTDQVLAGCQTSDWTLLWRRGGDLNPGGLAPSGLAEHS